jgi:hypothetical protein
MMNVKGLIRAPEEHYTIDTAATRLPAHLILIDVINMWGIRPVKPYF